MAGAWTYQKTEDLKTLGAEKAPWYVGWYEPDGRRKGKCCGEGFHGKKTADRLRNKITSELMTGTYQIKEKKLWTDFRAEYERRVLPGKAVRTRDEVLAALNHFERIVKPVRVFAIDTGHVDDFIAARREERGRKPGTHLSVASVNKELRHLKAVLKKAVKWGYVKNAPDFAMERVPQRVPTYVSPEHFALLYQACEHARRPKNLPYPVADWWRGLLITAYMTGWRIGQLLSLRRDDVDLDAGTALSRAEDNKGKRDQLIPLHPIVVEHLRRLPSFEPVFFPWDRSRRQLFAHFEEIQEQASVKPNGPKERYGFHDLRRAFATMNADNMTLDALQTLMQHKDYHTTQGYIDLARQLNPAVQALFVPDVTRKTGG